MVVVLRNIDDVNSTNVQYQTFAGRGHDDLRLAYEWLIFQDPQTPLYNHLIVKTNGNNGFPFFQYAGIAEGEKESTRKLYARAWLDCMNIVKLCNELFDETDNDDKFSLDSFAETLAKYQSRHIGLQSPFHKELKVL